MAWSGGIFPLPGGLTNCCPSVLDTVGWVIWLVKIVSDMTYNVFGGTLNPTLLLLRPGEVILMLSVDRQLLLIDVECWQTAAVDWCRWRSTYSDSTKARSRVVTDTRASSSFAMHSLQLWKTFFHVCIRICFHPLLWQVACPNATQNFHPSETQS